MTPASHSTAQIPLNRRGLLLAAASLVAAPRVARAQSHDVDVVVVGAGAAGLSAARIVAAAGRKVQILEARDRIGGRAYTDTSLGAPYDAGAANIHWSDRNPWIAFARELGVPIVSEGWGGGFAVYQTGRQMTEAERNERRRAFGQVWNRLDSLGDKDGPLSWGAATPAELAAARSIIHFTMGDEPERVSAADYARLWSGSDYEVPGGYGALVQRFGAGLPIRLSTPVDSIGWDGAGVTVNTAAGALSAQTVIVTVPVGVLQAGGIRFVPGLPAPTLAAIDGLQMGALTKIALRIEGDRLGFDPASSLFDAGDADAPLSVEMWPFDRNLAVMMLGGDHARRVVGLGPDAAIAYATDRLAAMLGDRVRARITGGHLAGWWSDPWARGSYSLCKPGQAGARDELARPVAGRLWFAGEATAGGASVTVGGATLAGQAAARQALAALR